MSITELTTTQRDLYQQWVLELTATPTAAGYEDRVLDWIHGWVDERSDDLVIESDEFGNRIIRRKDEVDGPPRLYITAHLDHPAFVVESFNEDGTLALTFRGTVRDPYFVDAPILIYPHGSHAPIRATIVHSEATKPLRTATARVEGDSSAIIPGSIGVWDLPEQEIDGDGILRTNACDDLAGVAAALGAMDAMRADDRARHVRLLFTRAEEVGFIGTLAACRGGTVPMGSKLLTLETSRSFAESPIGAGPIVRIGDRITTFAPDFTAAIAHVATSLEANDDSFQWQRKLMAGGACEATAFCAYGYEATCVCLPLGNYHNQGDLSRVETEGPDRAKVGREFISMDDYFNLIRLLIGCGIDLGSAPAVMDRLKALYDERSWIVTDRIN